MVPGSPVEAYRAQMVTVWMRDDQFGRRTRFHRVPTCRQLQKRPSRGEKNDLIQVDLKDAGVRPCLTCYPDAPRYNLLKRWCEVCGTRNACEHNGGVLITDRRGRRFWVWPDTNQMPFYRRQNKQQSA